MQDMSKNFVNYGFLLESLNNIKKMHSSRVIAGYNTVVFYIKNEANRLFVSIFSWVIFKRLSISS